ncbi:MAG: ATP-binding protein [Gammaproteobacteria bacterium]|nr:ATP-binding protein [Gammaproteobacteria bacterium]MCY4219587.1 ATP-binding protein [Gammaproteobacteria bacterium]MCY4276206.1 ATP-binding protein [Gammaproteobacteria bacterium]
MIESKLRLKNLFQPGTGVEPPYLAGRLEEQAFFNDQVEKLIEKRKIGRDMIVYGPRGNGKTAMLRYLQKRTDDRIETLWVTPSEFEDMGELIDLIVGNDTSLLTKAREIVRPVFDNLSASANIGVAQVKTGLSRPKETLALKALLREKCKKKPFIMIMDEAHTLNPDIGMALLNASQDIRGEDWPLFLVLSGTPDLETTLNQSSATFWDKSNVFPLGRLSLEDAQLAIEIPLQSCKVSCVKGVVEEVVHRAHNYPYFIQIWGDCIANRLIVTESQQLTMEKLLEAEHSAIAKCANIYKQRYNELNKLNLMLLATDIGNSFTETGNQSIPVQKLEKLVGLSLQKQGVLVSNETVQENIRKLSHIGYIWQITVHDEVKGEDPLLCYEPGIPSLMNFVRKQSLL